MSTTEDFRRFARYAAESGEWTPWAEFVDWGWFCLTNRAKVQDSVGAWRKAREHVLRELSALGLEGSVFCTDQHEVSDNLRDHKADTAGLVRLAPEGLYPMPQLYDLGEIGTTEADYIGRMYCKHALSSCKGIPTTLRGFCGQIELPRSSILPYDVPITPPGKPWLDHVRTWADPITWAPALTAELYAPDYLTIAKELSELPLTVTVQPGLWSPRTTLFIFRWAPDKTPLPAERKTLIQRVDFKSVELVRVYV